ncbi:MAG TPA: polyprenyl synthetase family protein [Anaerolineales bacterium]|nr:polyprenyl synthetase family protein [Anaerolineales bacterium]
MEVTLSSSFILEKFISILRQIDLSWNRSGAWQDYQTAMRQTLPNLEDLRSTDFQFLRLALLPGLCCEGAGGQFEWADRVAAAWVLFYNSAHILDNVEDNDPPDPCWSATDPGVAINAASGLIFSAYLCLQQLFDNHVNRELALRIIDDFSNTLLGMGSGQHQDLREPNPGLESWLKVAGAKSGSFFALACRAGSQLATDDPQRIQSFNNFGYHLGILVQLLDDIGDFKALHQGDTPVHPEALNRSMVVAYALEVLPEEQNRRLLDTLAAIADDPTAARDAIYLIDQCGAGLYLAIEIERQRQSGLNALAAAAPQNGAGEKLTLLMTGLLEE